MWTNAEDFLKDEKIEDKVVTGRPSVARLRSQNVGMVLEKAKLFSTLVEPDKAPNKPNEKKPWEIKKRNSSKSSKERKVQRTDSRKNNRKSKKEHVGLEQSGQSDTVPNREQNIFISQRRNPQHSLQGSVNKTNLDGKKPVQNRFKENSSVHVASGKHSSRVLSPLKDRNVCNSPGSLPSQPFNKNKLLGRSPKTVPRDGRITPKSLYSTPRKSPRQILLKSQYLSKLNS